MTVLGLLLDGAGGARQLGGDELRAWTPERGALWVQMDPDTDDGRRWLADSGLPSTVQSMLRAPVTQTHVEVLDDGGLIFAMRNFFPETGAEAEMRVVAGAGRLITASQEMAPALRTCAGQLARGKGPRTPVELILAAMTAAHERDQAATLALDERMSDLEYETEHTPTPSLEALRALHQNATALRRRLAAQRTGLAQIRQNGGSWILGDQREAWQQLTANRTTLVDTLDAVVDRTRALQDYAQGQLSAQLNDRVYVLTVISAILLPLSFLTGLLGVNLGGVPARETPWAFPVFCALLVLMAAGEYALMRRLSWFPERPPRTHTRTR